MYNPGVTILAPGIAFVANSKISVIDISIDGSKQVLFDVTTPWNVIAPDGGGVEGETFRWTSGNYVLMMKIMAVNEVARTATFRLLSFAGPSTTNYFTTTHNLPASAAPGSVLNYTFDVTNITSSPTSVRWIFGSQESTGTGVPFTFADWLEPNQLESFPSTTIVRNKNCWYEDWAIGGVCATGQIIMPGGFIRISGSLTVLAAIGKRENATLAVFVNIPGFWQTVAPGGPGGDEYVLSYWGGSLTDVSILSDPCAGKVCTPDYICVGCDSYNAICNPADPTGPCIQGTLRTTNDPLCVYGTLRVTSVPTGANIYVNDVLRGTTPLDITLVAGAYTVKLTLLNYQDYVNNNVVVACGGITPLSVTVSPGEEIHYLYFKVPELYPVWYVISNISPIFQAVVNAVSGYTNYYVYGVDFDQTDYTLTVTIKKTLGLSTIGLGTMGSDVRIQTMIAPIVYVLAIMAIAIISSVAQWFFFWYMGSKSVTGETVSTRVITVVPKICTGDASTGILNCVNPTSPAIISVEYCIGNSCTTTEITDGNPMTISVPTDSGITITGRVKDNPYYTVVKKSIDKGITNDTVTLEFVAKEDATVIPEVIDATTGNPIIGSYIIYEETTDGHMVEAQRGNLDANGKVAPPYKAKAGVFACTIIVPVDIAVYKVQMDCIIPAAGEVLTPKILIKTCSEAKNHVSVRTVYIAADGSRLGYTADSIQIKVGTNVVNTVVPTTDITYIDGLDKNTTYTVHITKAGYALLNNDQQVSFTTDCDTTVSLMVEANPPAGARDITIEVRNATTNVQIQGANVFLDSMPVRKTGITGTVLFTAIPDGNHDLKITLEGYKDNISKINISSTSTSFSKTLTVDQVNATVDTRIYNFTNVGDAIATKPIKFKGSLHYLDTGVSPATYKPLQDATVVVNVKDVNNTILKTFTVVTKNGLLDSGDFETGEWLISDTLTNVEITVEAIFEGIGRYKSSSSSTSYVVASADSCVIPLPWGGCLLSKETGTTILLVGALIVGGIIVLNVAPALLAKKR